MTRKMSEEKDEETRHVETELEKLIREVKQIEKQELIDEKEHCKVKDAITSHYDKSTIQLKYRKMYEDHMLSESLLRSTFS